jgi:hypothetical protein
MHVRLPLRYPQLRDVSRLVTFQSCSVALIDTDKANVINLREKKYTRYTLIQPQGIEVHQVHPHSTSGNRSTPGTPSLNLWE